MCFIALRKAFDTVPWNVFVWAMKMKGIPEILGRSVMSVYEVSGDKSQSGF